MEVRKMARTSDVMVAFLSGKSRTIKEHRTDGQTYWLHGHPIIRKDKRAFIIDACGWPTRTTFAVLNEICCVGGRKYVKTDYHGRQYEGLYIGSGKYGRESFRNWNGDATKLKLAEVQIS